MNYQDRYDELENIDNTDPTPGTLKAKEESNKIGSFLKEKLNSSIILGPTVCSVFRMNNLYRFNIIIKYKKEENLYKALNYLQEHYKNINNVDIDIDFNPINI